MGLRELVAAWQERAAECDRAYRLALDSINRELDAVGGYATTGPDENGLCLSFHRANDSFGSGIARAGERHGGTGPSADAVAPYHPEVGDRCLELEQVWRGHALRSAEAVHAVRAYVTEIAGATEPEYVALALCRSEEEERKKLTNTILRANDLLFDSHVNDPQHQVDCHADTLPQVFLEMAAGHAAALETLQTVIHEWVEPEPGVTQRAILEAGIGMHIGDFAADMKAAMGTADHKGDTMAITYTPEQRKRLIEEAKGKRVASLEWWEPDGPGDIGYWVMSFEDGSEVSFRLMAELC
jgi:hypothetical protein